ncbi:MAG TPA: dihydroneopterin aldolase [Xanthobacteraceae bacterium]|nr:dihydroneopterin aldolase [Xanthobacteraceae bacterium]
MSDRIFVNGLVLHAYHGVMPHEGKVGQPFIIDVALDVDLSGAAKSDKVVDTVSYDVLVGVISRSFTARRCRLVEAAAGAVADAILHDFPRVTEVQVTVRKPHAPVAAVFHDVGVTLARRRHG